MSDPIIVHTIRDERTLACPLCPATIDVPPVPRADAVAEALGMGGAVLQQVHAEQEAKRASAKMRTHLGNHSIEEWLGAIR